MTATSTLFRAAPADGKRRRPVSGLQPGRFERAPQLLPEHDRLPEARDAQALRADGAPTLDDLIVGTWEGLAAHRTVSCPVCGGTMSPRYGAGADAVGGRCADCRSTLA